MVLSSTRNRQNPQGFDIEAPFRLTYELLRVRFAPSRAVLEF
jgi:hypothetical protein